MGKKLGDKAPKIFYVNWFRKSSDGKFLWPGFSDNSRVLKWMCERVDGKVGTKHTAIGQLPNDGDLDLNGLNISAAEMKELTSINPGEWKAEISGMQKHFETFGNRLPEELSQQLREFIKRLG